MAKSLLILLLLCCVYESGERLGKQAAHEKVTDAWNRLFPGEPRKPTDEETLGITPFPDPFADDPFSDPFRFSDPLAEDPFAYSRSTTNY